MKRTNPNLSFRLSLLFVALFQTQYVPTSLAYKYPNPQIAEADHRLYDQSGHNANVMFTSGVPDCGHFFTNGTGRQNAAEWLRTAFHDMSTHDATTGTGGLDASIAVEAFRPENAGTAINSTVQFLLPFITPTLGLADFLALGARTALDACNGPEVPFRVGRVDNFTIGPSGVPQAQDNIQSHLDAFTRMGFTQQEMIGLVACGHTIGGVHHNSFPDIVPPPADPSTNSEGVQHFDSTFDVYDNKVAAEFVNGVPNNPLAYGANVTTNSDFRIFASDGNATISSLAASQDTFMSTCGTLFERMLNTVPSSVNLTDVITPIPVKPTIYLDLQPDGNLIAFGEVRFFDMQINPNRVVNFTWLDRNGQCSQGICSATATHANNQVATTSRNVTSVWYSFNATIDSTASISQFWFEVDEGDGSGPKQMNSETGSPFPLEDRLFILPSKSCDQFHSDGTSVVRVTFAIRQNSDVQIANPEILATSLDISFTEQTYARSDFTAPAAFLSNSTSPNYQLYNGTFASNGFSTFYFFDIAAQIGGQDVRDIGWAVAELEAQPFVCPK